ncbi:formyltransferase family protein [uncultured Hoeflea sp.]|uniref:formyltransferase family protein n=1 Tax=uncultured Hoeflea sp. TaxID=538666 RepID=UPI0030EB1EEF|tara:strand:+ start:27810 stop:28493 length:684 start_codon:yes stop_codon:yes gene_type:complete
MNMKLAMVCSAGGGSVLQAFDLAATAGLVTPADILVIVDRPCGAESGAAARLMTTRRIEEPNRVAFSARAAVEMKRFGADAALLSFSRLVSEELYGVLPTLNIHPSLLPSFPGIGAVAAARTASARILGASLHRVDAGTDTGPLLGQAWSPACPQATAEVWNRQSFIHKTYLAALVIEEASRGRDLLQIGHQRERRTPNACPALEDNGLIGGFQALLAERKMEHFVP